MQLFFTASLFVMLGLLAHGSSGAPTALRSSGNDDAADDGELLSQLTTILEKEQSDEGNGDEDNADPGDVYAASQTEKRGSKKKFGKGGKIVGNILGGLLNGVLGGMGGSEKKRQTYGANGDEDDVQGLSVEDVDNLMLELELVEALNTLEEEDSDGGNGGEDNADLRGEHVASQTEKRGFLKNLKKGGKKGGKILGKVGKVAGSLISGILGGMGGSEEKRQTYEANGDEDDVEGLSVEDVEDLLLDLELVDELNSLEEEDSDGGNGDEDNADLREENATSQTEKRGFLKKLTKVGKKGGNIVGGLLGGILGR